MSTQEPSVSEPEEEESAASSKRRERAEADDAAKDDTEGDEPPAKRPPFLRIFLATVALIIVCDLLSRFYLSSRQNALDAEHAKQYPPNTYVTSFATRQDYRFINLYTMNPQRGAGTEYRFDEMGFRLDRRNLKFGEKDGFKHIW